MKRSSAAAQLYIPRTVFNVHFSKHFIWRARLHSIFVCATLYRHQSVLKIMNARLGTRLSLCLAQLTLFLVGRRQTPIYIGTPANFIDPIALINLGSKFHFLKYQFVQSLVSFQMFVT